MNNRAQQRAVLRLLHCSTNSSFLPCSLPAPVLAAQRSHTVLSSVTLRGDISPSPPIILFRQFQSLFVQYHSPLPSSAGGTINKTPYKLKQTTGK